MKKERQHKSWPLWCGVCLLVALLALCSGIFYASLKSQLYRERQEHLSELTIKISEILNTEMDVMQQKADAAQNLLNIGSKTEYETTGELLEAIRSILCIDNGELLAVNEKSTFYTSSGYYARWSTPEDLAEESEIPMIRELTFHGTKDTYMIFMRMINEKAAYDEEGNELTHVIVAIPLTNMESEFTITGFGENIFTYMINSSGRRLYKQTFSSAFIEEFNVLTALEDYKFSEDGALETLEDAIRNRSSACTEFKVPDTKQRFFVSNVPIEDTDWSVLVFVPTKVIGENSNNILANGLRFFAVILLLAAGILSLLLTLNFRRISGRKLKLQQEENSRMLEAAAQEADRTNQAKTEFLAQMAQEIRTPLNSIVGLVSLAQKNASDAEVFCGCLNDIDRASDHLISLINNVLEMSRIECGRININQRPINIKTIVENCCSVVEGQMGARGIEFVRDFDRLSHVMLIGDEQRLRQIFINILGNAVKFTPDGGRVVFRMKELESSGETSVIRFEVEDNGIGMSEEFVGHLFEPFSQEYGEHPGVGLGMAITKKYIGMMGGRITASSALNEGTSICMELTFEVFDADNLLEDQKEQSLKGMSILIVGESNPGQEMVQQLLEDAGIRVVTAPGGKAAVEIFEDSAWNSFDAILMDVMMPEMSGYEVTQAIRCGVHPKGPAIPIIALTCNSYVEDIAAALSSGMNAHVPKPVEASYLFEVLSQYYHAE